jgi:hypothetical protein
METRETKDAIDTIKMKSRNMSLNIAIMKKEISALGDQLVEANKKLERIASLLEEQERRRLVQK